MTPPLPPCAVVVVNYGSTALLRHNLVEVAAAIPDLAVVVVDNFTSPAELADVTALCAEHGWTLVASPTNLGFGSAMNRGAAAAIADGAEQLLVLNPDARLDAASTARLRETVAADPMVLAAPVTLTTDGRLWSDGTDLHLDRGRMRSTRKRGDVPESAVAPWLSGACLLVSRTLWERLDGFDPRYFLYWEDVDLSWRARELGAELRVVRDAEAVHDEGATSGSGGSRERSATYYYYNIRNRLVFAAHHLDRAGQRRWRRTAAAEAWDILLRGGRRQLLRSAAPWRAALTGTRDGLALMRRTRRARPVPAGPLRVLQSFPDPKPTTNPYIWMLQECLVEHPGVELDTFTWGRALRGNYDVFHAHWPEILVNGASPLKKLVRQLLFVAFLLRLRQRGTAVVRTLHNLELPSGISRREVALLRWFERETALLVRVNASTEIPDRPYATVLHGHYRGWFAPYPRSEPVPGRLVYFGLVRRYKAVDRLLRVFAQTARPGLSLWVGGRPSTPELRAEITGLAEVDDRVSTQLEFLSDAELVAGGSAGQVVVLPYREMHNSGSVLAALSLDRPVLVPDNEVNRRLAAEVGPGWVHRYTGDLTAQDLEDVVAAAGAVAGARPDLSAREWTDAAERHVQAYRHAMAVRAGRVDASTGALEAAPAQAAVG